MVMPKSTAIIAVLAALLLGWTVLLMGEQDSPSVLLLRRRSLVSFRSAVDPKTIESKEEGLSVAGLGESVEQYGTGSGGYNTAMASPEDPIIVNVYVAYPEHPVAESHLFDTDVATRYGSGRVKYNVIKHGEIKKTNDPGPCIAIGHHDNKRWTQLDYRKISRAYPHCKYMNGNDEKCKAPDGFDFRQYYSARHEHGFYVPLSMRYDSWLSFQSIKGRDDNFELKPPSQRKYAFNSMMSLSTNYERQDLAKILEREEAGGARGLTNHIKLTDHWTASFDTTPYMEVLLDSVFTLSPIGHSPECFRNYEAIEAGSIPVMLKHVYDGMHHGRCLDTMKYWNDAPLLYLESWEDLYPTVKSLMEDLEALDEMYLRLREWYDEFMRGRFTGIEDVVLDSYS